MSSPVDAQDAGRVLRQIQSDINQDQRRPLSVDRERAIEGVCVEKVVAPQRTAEGAPSENGNAEQAKNDIEITLNRIDVAGAVTLRPEAIDKITRKHISDSAKLFETIDALITEITQAYSDRGYPLTRVYVPSPQDLNSGTLQLQVIEVKTGQIQILENDRERRGVDMAFPGLTGKQFNLRDFEQGIDQINRLSSKNAKIDLLPTDKQDETRVRVCTEVSGPVTVNAEVNNLGTESTGRRQAEIGVILDDVFGLYEQFSFQTRRDIEGRGSALGSENYSASLSVPYGYWTASVSGSYYKYRTTITGAAQSFRTSGSQATIEAGLDRVLWRTQNSVTSLGASLTYKDVDNFIAGNRLETGSRALSIASLDLTHRGSFWGGAFRTTVGISRGLDILGAPDDTNLSRTQPHAQFWRTRFDLDYAKPFALFDQVLTWRSRVSAQWAPHALYGSEQFFIGGHQSVRGFREDSLGGEFGALWNNDLTYRPPLQLPSSLTRVFGVIELNAGVDIGSIWENYALPSEEGTLIGSQLSVRTTGGHLYSELSWNRGWSFPNSLQSDTDFFLFRAGARF